MNTAEALKAKGGFEEAKGTAMASDELDRMGGTTTKQGFLTFLKKILGYAGKARTRMVLAILCACISVLGGFVPFYATYQIIMILFTDSPSLSLIIPWVTVSLAGMLIKMVFRTISTMLSHISAYHILENLRKACADKLMRAPLGSVTGTPIGRLKNIIVDRIESIELPLAHMIPEGISCTVLPLLVFVYLIVIDWRMALATLVCVPIGGLLFAILMRDYSERYETFMKSNNHVNNVIVEYIEGIEVIKAFNQSARSYEKFTKTIRDFFEYTMDWYRSTWKIKNLAESVLPTTLLGALPMGIWLYSQGQITPADLIMCIILSLSIIGSITWFNQGINYYKNVEYAIRDTEELLHMAVLENSEQEKEAPAAIDHPAERAGTDKGECAAAASGTEAEASAAAMHAAAATAGPSTAAAADATAIRNAPTPAARSSLKGIKDFGLRFDRVSFAYDDEDRNVLHDFSLNLSPNSFTALVGPSGGGKSTVARLAARFWDVGSGSISLGEKDIRNIRLEDLSILITYVTQDNFLFRTSLFENIRIGKPGASDEEVLAAARFAQCEDFIARLHDGWDTDAGEAGKKLSGGERQRIAIARAILKDTPIVILDEATAFTDPENEDKIQHSLMALTKNKTLLVIAHRLSTIKNADTIVVLEDGRIRESGRHEELLENGKLYHTLWQAHTSKRNWTEGAQERVSLRAGGNTPPFAANNEQAASSREGSA